MRMLNPSSIGQWISGRDKFYSISLIAEGMVVKKSDTIRAILPSCERSGMFACRVLLNLRSGSILQIIA
jgi:hypothetical protein